MNQTMQKAQNSRSYAFYRVQLTLKKCSYKKTECSIKWKLLFPCYVIALAQEGNNSIHFEVLLGTLSMTFFCLGTIIKLKKLLIPGY